MYEQSSASLEYVRVPVAARSSGEAVDPTGGTGYLAFLKTAAAPSSGDWKTASWDIDNTTSPPTYRAQCLVGPGGTVTLTAGIWTVWVKVTDSPEVPVKRAGQIKIY